MSQKKPEQPAVKMRSRGSTEFAVHTFDFEPAFALKNRAWKLGDLTKIHRVEHDHIYHSTNDRTGSPNIYTAPMLGHFHKIQINWNKKVVYKKKLINGAVEEIEGPEIICGPPLQWKTFTIGDRRLKKAVPIIHEASKELKDFGDDVTQEELERFGATKDIKDTHTHTGIYLGTEVMTMGSRGALAKKSVEEIRAAAESDPGALNQIQKMTGLQNAMQNVGPEAKEELAKVTFSEK